MPGKERGDPKAARPTHFLTGHWTVWEPTGAHEPPRGESAQKCCDHFAPRGRPRNDVDILPNDGQRRGCFPVVGMKTFLAKSSQPRNALIEAVDPVAKPKKLDATFGMIDVDTKEVAPGVEPG